MSKAERNFAHYRVFRNPRDRAIRALNDTYVLTRLTDKSLRAAQRTMRSNEGEPEQYEVPSSGGETIALSRDPTEIIRLLENAYQAGIHEQAIIAAVALTEDYLQTTLRIVLRWFPQKLKQNIVGDQVGRNVSLDMVLAAKSKKQLVSRLIDKQLQGIFYGAPSRYFEYIETILNVGLPSDLKDQFAEIKATRDVIVHNSGRVNEIYLQKAGQLARAANREQLPVTTDYFTSTIACLKKLVIALYKQILEKYGDIELLNAEEIAG